ncbi:hypothetical protein KQI77_10655 [Clostridium sp. MSJ-8]|uniref:DUF6762 family protein n=1 Tax=Clostridium sp. MSJ-8 TaxID=2841510 RepID=UPI001C0EEDEC|nr:DUF6762 family protein [Clostridium sp. MSJ-8]MBU5488588.1 hypothetical protein [Clostridium sp. MSJ-8]
MDFSSLVIMEKDKETGYIKKELGSFEVTEGAVYVTKLYEIDGIVYLYFDTERDVEEWEYSAIYDLFNTEVFEEAGFKITEDDDEYNPTFILEMPYKEEHGEMKELLDRAVELIEQEMNNVFKAIEGKEEEYVD